MKALDSFRVVLFWTELKLLIPFHTVEVSFRVVLFWTELKPIPHNTPLMLVF